MNILRAILLWIRDFFRGPQVSDNRLVGEGETRCRIVCVRFKGGARRAVSFAGLVWHWEDGSTVDLDSWLAITKFVEAIRREERRVKDERLVALALANDTDVDCEASR